MLPRAALDLFFLGEEPLELRVGFVDDLRGGCLRLLGFTGSSIRLDLLCRRPTTPASGTHDPSRAGGPCSLADRHRRFPDDLLLGCDLVGQHIALVDPHLDAYAPVGCASFRQTEVNLGAQRVQRHTAFAVPLLAAHLGPTEASAALNAYAERAGLHRSLYRSLHRPPERHASHQLICDSLGDQRSVQLRLLDLLDVEVDLRVPSDLVESGAQAVGLGAATSDHNSRARSGDVDAKSVAGPLHFDTADSGALQLAPQVVADLPVLDQLVSVLLAICDPTGLPVGRDAEAEPVGVDLLTHYSDSSTFTVSPVASASPVCCSSTACPAGASAASTSAAPPAATSLSS